MSGGSYDYFCSKVSDFIQQLKDNEEFYERDSKWENDHYPTVPRVWNREAKVWIEGEEAEKIIAQAHLERRWFMELLEHVATVAHDIEWVDSGDYGPGDEVFSLAKLKEFIKSTA